MIKDKISFGRAGELAAVNFLKENGYKILAYDYKTKLGQIDIIAREREVICFIEVKTRSSDRFGLPIESISLFKQRQISKAALLFLKQNNLLDKNARFDVVSVLYLKNSFKFNLVRNAFELEIRYAL